jgi:hypothetical protein
MGWATDYIAGVAGIPGSGSLTARDYFYKFEFELLFFISKIPLPFLKNPVYPLLPTTFIPISITFKDMLTAPVRGGFGAGLLVLATNPLDGLTD